MSGGCNVDSNFVFRRNDEIGSAGAEDDSNFLAECFVDTGDFATLRDCGNAKRIIVGRTGAGKTALLSEIERQTQNVITLSPHSLSLNYVANNTVIRFFEDAGVNLSPFYGLLWKHIIVVELLKSKYNICTEDSYRTCIRRIRDLLSNNRIKEQAIDYLEKWGNRFWLTTEERMRELTNRIENSLSSSLGAGIENFNVSAEGARSLTTEQKLQVVERGKQAVSAVQIRELENLIAVLDEAIFTDRQQHYYIAIDTLDEEWADDRIRFRLIRSLIDAVRRFRKVSNIKIILALRQDLLRKVLHSINDPGFQEEKYEALYLHVRWDKKQLREVLEKRLNALVRRRYSGSSIAIEEFFPNKIDGCDALDYIISRTFLRPRDAILFVNDCIAFSEGKASFTAAVIKRAEEEYSNKRLQSLASEWQILHPNLKPVIEIFYGMKNHFAVGDITKEFLCEKYEESVSCIHSTDDDPITASLDKLYTQDGNFPAIRNFLVRSLYSVGVFGIKVGPTASTDWVYDSRLALSAGQVRASTTIYIHPMFYRALGIRI